VGWEGIDWIDLAQERDRLWVCVDAVTNCRVPYNAGNSLTENPLPKTGFGLLEFSLFVGWFGWLAGLVG
jgi:hypothetical protein